MKKLMYKLKTILTREAINHFEIDYIKDEPYFLQVRLYHEDLETGNRIAGCIKNANTGDKIRDIMVYTPHEDTVKFGFSGVPFTAIDLELDLQKAVELREDFLLMDDNLHEL